MVSVHHGTVTKNSILVMTHASSLRLPNPQEPIGGFGFSDLGKFRDPRRLFGCSTDLVGLVRWVLAFDQKAWVVEVSRKSKSSKQTQTLKTTGRASSAAGDCAKPRGRRLESRAPNATTTATATTAAATAATAATAAATAAAKASSWSYPSFLGFWALFLNCTSSILNPEAPQS